MCFCLAHLINHLFLKIRMFCSGGWDGITSNTMQLGSIVQGSCVRAINLRRSVDRPCTTPDRVNQERHAFSGKYHATWLKRFLNYLSIENLSGYGQIMIDKKGEPTRMTGRNGRVFGYTLWVEWMFLPSWGQILTQGRFAFIIDKFLIFVDLC